MSIKVTISVVKWKIKNRKWKSKQLLSKIEIEQPATRFDIAVVLNNYCWLSTAAAVRCQHSKLSTHASIILVI